MRVSLAQRLGSRQASSQADGKVVNAYFDSDGKVRWVLKRPGLAEEVLSPAISAGTAQGMTSFNGKLYLVVGGALYEVSIGTGVLPGAAPKILNQTLLNQNTLG